MNHRMFLRNHLLKLELNSFMNSDVIVLLGFKNQATFGEGVAVYVFGVGGGGCRW